MSQFSAQVNSKDKLTNKVLRHRNYSRSKQVVSFRSHTFERRNTSQIFGNWKFSRVQVIMIYFATWGRCWAALSIICHDNDLRDPGFLNILSGIEKFAWKHTHHIVLIEMTWPLCGTQSKKSAKEVLMQLYKVTKEVGLKINDEKAEIMT